MDPIACWNEINEIIATITTADNDDDDRERLAELLSSLADWIRHGGFIPKRTR